MNILKKQKWLRVFAILLIVVGIGFLLLDPLKGYLIKEIIEENNSVDLTVEVVKKNEEAPVDFSFDQTVPVNWEDVLAVYQSREDLPVIGGMAIPSLNLQLPVLKGLSEANLIAGAGTMTPDQEMGKGNYSLVSHNVARSGVLFTDIQRIEVGELVYITDMTHIYVYEISSLEMVSPTRVDVIEEVPGEQLLTLVTCSDDILSRWIAQGHLLEEVPMDQATDEMVAALSLAVE